MRRPVLAHIADHMRPPLFAHARILDIDALLHIVQRQDGLNLHRKRQFITPIMQLQT